ncbi:MAG: c-type cytochrome [Sulfurimonas sp.]|nr:c-type cytochrome [Sulfurimonas sp.]
MLGATYIAVTGTKGGLNDDIINILTIAGAVSLVIITVFVVIKYVRQMQTDTADGVLARETWDGIAEYENELPVGWAVTFLLTIVWGMWYFIAGYPLNAYSQIGEYNEEVVTLTTKFEKDFNEKMSNFSETEKTQYMIDMGESVYITECMICHGLTADGIDGLSTDLNNWGTHASIVDAIVNGSKGLNYPMGDMAAGFASGQDATDIAVYIMNDLSGETGSIAYDNACAGCHGTDGKGLDGSSPDLLVYGESGFIVDVLNRGKKGFIGDMPKFDRLSDKQKEAVGAYISSLNK